MHTWQDLGRKFSSMALKKTHYKHYLVTNYTLTQHSSVMINVLLAKEKKIRLPAYQADLANTAINLSIYVRKCSLKVLLT